MAASDHPQTTSPRGRLLVGVDVGGTFTDLVAWDGATLRIIKIPSTPPDFHLAVIDAVGRVTGGGSIGADVVHGSTVATNALLQRAGERIAFVTTEGFRDMLLIGRQNRPELYALHVRRAAPLAAPDDCFTLRGRIDARGEVVAGLDEAEIDRVAENLRAARISHVAVCFLFSFLSAAHEQHVGRRLMKEGFTVSLSSDLLPEFREYERASTTAINAYLRPTVERYLGALERSIGVSQARRHEGTEARSEEPGDSISFDELSSPSCLGAAVPSCLSIMHSSGGTMPVAEAAEQAAKLVLSGPAGGALGAAFVARAAGAADVITYDMGGTSTDVATVLNGAPQWTTASVVDGLPLALPMFDIHTVGAGGGSIAYVDEGGALRVGPRSAGAVPGPACYGRGGTLPTVTDANLVLGRIRADAFLGGAMTVDVELARRAIAPVAERIGKDVVATALGIVRIAEANMAAAVRAVTSRRGHDPRNFSLVSFGGAGGLHACAIAEALDVRRVLIPPYAGVLSALGMVVAQPVTDASQTVLHLGEGLDDHRLIAEYGRLAGRTSDRIPYEQTASTEAYADVRFAGQSYELTVRVLAPSIGHVREQFLAAYAAQYGRAPEGRAVEIVTLRFRRYGRAPDVALPALAAGEGGGSRIEMVDEDGVAVAATALDRGMLLRQGPVVGPALLIDADATTLIPRGWRAAARADGIVTLERVIA